MLCSYNHVGVLPLSALLMGVVRDAATPVPCTLKFWHDALCQFVTAIKLKHPVLLALVLSTEASQSGAPSRLL